MNTKSLTFTPTKIQPIKKGRVYGSFKVVKRFENDDGSYTYGCICEECGAKKKLTNTLLHLKPTCDHKKSNDGDVRGVKKHIKDKMYKLTANFGADAETIQKLLDEADRKSGFDKFQASVLKSLLELVVIAEDAYRERPSQSNAYAYNSFVSQAREIITEMLTAEDMSDMPLRLARDVLAPEFTSIAQTILNEMYTIKKELGLIVPPEKLEKVEAFIDNSTREIAAAVDTSFRNFQTKSSAFFITGG